MEVAAIAKMIDHSLLSPTLTDEQLRQGCELARKYDLATVCIKPYAVPLAKEVLAGSNVRVGTVIGFPQGSSTIPVKAFETEQAIGDGAVEIDMVVNIGKVLSGDWEYIEREIGAVVAVTNRGGALLKVIFENDLLPDDEHKIKLCEICSKLKVGFVKTSSGYNYVRGPDGKYSYEGATDHDLKLMREHSDPEVGVKAAGGVGNLDAILRVRDLGVTRIGTSHSEEVIKDAMARPGD